MTHINSLRWLAAVGLEPAYTRRPLYHCAMEANIVADLSVQCNNLLPLMILPLSPPQYLRGQGKGYMDATKGDQENPHYQAVSRSLETLHTGR